MKSKRKPPCASTPTMFIRYISAEKPLMTITIHINTYISVYTP